MITDQSPVAFSDDWPEAVEVVVIGAEVAGEQTSRNWRGLAEQTGQADRQAGEAGRDLASLIHKSTSLGIPAIRLTAERR